MNNLNRARWLAGLLALLVWTAASAAEVHVLISGGFFEAYSELAPEFERSTGHRLVATRGPSLGDSPESIPSRLKRGEPGDVVIMVGASIDALTRQGLVRNGSKVDFARSEIGMVVRAGQPKPDIATIDAFRRALLDAKSVACSDSASGIYLSTTLFAKLGIAEPMAAKTRRIPGPPSGELVAAVVARGDAEVGFQQVSELIHTPGATFVGTIPAELQQETFFSGALASGTRESDAALALIRFLASPQAAPAIRKAGLRPLAGS